jgi:hypothetical protein
VVLHCAPSGKYESIAVADAFYCSKNNPLLTRGGPDMDGFELSMVDVIPYECLDGINEMGFAACLLRVDIKEGEQPCGMVAGSSIMLRYLLDNCARKPSSWWTKMVSNGTTLALAMATIALCRLRVSSRCTAIRVQMSIGLG